MKRFAALLLCLCFALSGCGAVSAPGGDGPSDPGQPTIPVQHLSRYAQIEAVLPQIPAQPSYAELDAKLTALESGKPGADEYDKEYDRLWAEFNAQHEAHYQAMQALRDQAALRKDMPPRFGQYSRGTIAQLLQSAEDQNVVYSPANLYLALAMLAETTDGRTRAELLALLEQEDMGALRAAAKAIWCNLYESSESGVTALANSLWMKEGVTTYNGETLQKLANDYFASLYSVPMGTSEADETLHAWINYNTGGLLKDAADGLKTNPATVMALVSALYFKDQWADEFYEGDTKEDVFTAVNGREQKVDFMHLAQDAAGCVIGSDFKMAQLRFRNGESMIFLLPDEGAKLSELLTTDALGSLLAGITPDTDGLEIVKLKWSVPKFDVNSNLDFIGAMKALGVSDAFDFDRADFSPLADLDDPVAVTQMQHAARVKVDEKGCEAAAFTAITADAAAAMPQDLPEVEMNLNRPFAFLITGVDGLPLFAGTVNTME